MVNMMLRVGRLMVRVVWGIFVRGRRMWRSIDVRRRWTSMHAPNMMGVMTVMIVRSSAITPCTS